MNKESSGHQKRRAYLSMESCKIDKKKRKSEGNESIRNILKKRKPFLASSEIFRNLTRKMLLPTHFRYILDNFISLDIVVNKLINRSECLYFHRIALVLGEMNQRDFNKDVFGQILKVFPESYSYVFDKSPLQLFGCEETLRLIPNISFAKDTYCSPRKSEKGFSLGQLLARKNCLQERLLVIVKDRHDEFLLAIKCPVSRSSEYSSKHIVWHPQFQLESCVDKIESEPLTSTDRPANASAHVSYGEVCKNLFATPQRHTGDQFLTAAIDGLCQTPLESPETMKQISNSLSKAPNTNVRESIAKQKLPFHLKSLFEMFITLDKLVRDVHCKAGLCYLSRIAPSVSVKSNFSDAHLGKIMAVYPEAFSVTWQRPPVINGRRPAKKLDIVIRPNLRNDCTQAALTWPAKGFVKFDFVQLAERRKLFLDRCVAIVRTSYAEYKSEKLSRQSHNGQGHDNHRSPKFNIELHVKMVEPIPMPAKPEETEDAKELTSVSQVFAIAKRRSATKCNPISPPTTDKVRQDSGNESTSRRNINALLASRRHIIVAKLPDIVKIIENEFHKQALKPLDRAYLQNVVCQSISIEANSVKEYLDVLMELVPGWIEPLDWRRPYLTLGKCRMNIEDVLEKLSELVVQQRSWYSSIGEL